MKKSMVLRVMAVAVLVAFALVSFHTGVAMAATKTAKDKAKSITKIGVLEEVGGEYVLKSGKTSTALAGQDFAPMKGKKVKVIGTMTKGAKGNVLDVTKITEVKKKGK